jgi:error-prone DNA polymerase
MNYVELHATSHFSFLRGVSSAEELFIAAAELGISSLGIPDLHIDTLNVKARNFR